MNAKHSIGAIVTACTYEKKPNPMPATLPNAKCGNLAVPPETGYIAPSSAWHRARTITTTPAMAQARTGGSAPRLRAVERADQPAGADDRGLGRPGGADQAHLSLEADVRRSGSSSDRLRCHGRTFFRVRIRGPYARE